ncbi:hypothetical protein O4H49_03975 [Kiloniella laminariae]|uniref:Glycerophosphoryl diester phosphodiesterase membrane domain-containing protein n=1 Tax=Kiloniella laminariae TaxID=454162 RepID=A0ABT4LFQ3_9PROT|nr:hypothetical protein [Kiloniella laminariae]MCZ4279922.1 hypothetical protein [Kiloniella laminariae]
MTAITSPSPQKLRVFDTLGQSFRLWGRNLAYFSLLGLMLREGNYLFEVVLEATPFTFEIYIPFPIRMLLLMVMKSLLTYGFYLLITRRCHHSPPQQNPAPKTARLNLALLLYVLTIVAFLPLIKLGSNIYLVENANIGNVFFQLSFLFNRIPGYILTLIFFVLVPVAVIEQQGIAKTLRRCLDLCRGHRLALFWLFLFNGILQIFFAVFIINFVPLINQGGLLISDHWIDYRKFSAQVILGLIEPFIVILWSATYANLIRIKSLQNPEHLKQVFD